jgi:hypothetical protein
MVESHNREQSSQPNLIPPEFVAMGKKRIKEAAAVREELFKTLQETNLSWFNRMEVEARLASEIGAKLTAARSIPEVTAAYQEWTSRRMEMASEDVRRLVADTQKIMETGMRLLSNGWLRDGQGGGT